MKSITEAYLKVISSNKVEEVKIEQLIETTVPEHLHHVPENWDHHSEVSEETSEKIRAVMTKGSFTHFPLNDEHSDGNPDVIEHLTNHGYEIKDYKKGIATIKKQVGNPEKGIPFYHKYVDESIGSVLNKTNASPEVKTSFMNDPARASSKSKKHVVISTSPLAIAGMSTGTTWRDQSCMNMEGGMYSHKLKDDSMHGTHVAFLVHHDDTTAFQHGEPSKPIARIALKPYHAGNDTIFRPETKTYGADTSSFTSAVSRWAAENYPAEVGKTYTKNAKVYDDTGNDVYTSLSKDDVESHIKHNVYFDQGASLDHEVINHGIDFIKTHFADKAPEERSAAVQQMSAIGNLSTAHVLKLNKLADDDITKRLLMMCHGDKASSSMMNEYVEKNEGERLPKKMLMNPKLSDEHLDMVEPDQYSFVRRSKLKDKHITKLVDSAVKDRYLSHRMTNNLHELKDKLKPEHLIKLTDSHNLPDLTNTIIKSSNFNKDVHDAIVNQAAKRLTDPTKHRFDSHKMIANLAKESKFASIEDVEKIPHESMYSTLAQNPHVPSETHKQLKDVFMRSSTGGNPDVRTTRWASGVFGFKSEPYNTIPKNISDHMTTEDFDKLTQHNYQTSFEDKKASNQFLDASARKMRKLDINVAHLHSNKDNSEDQFDKFLNAREKLQNHIENHIENINDHMNKHVDKDYSDVYHDEEEYHKTLNRIADTTEPTSIHGLEHYSHPEVEFDKHDVESEEHYNDHVKPVLRRLNRMKSAYE